jgi:hypothetical protein
MRDRPLQFLFGAPLGRHPAVLHQSPYDFDAVDLWAVGRQEFELDALCRTRQSLPRSTISQEKEIFQAIHLRFNSASDFAWFHSWHGKLSRLTYGPVAGTQLQTE